MSRTFRKIPERFPMSLHCMELAKTDKIPFVQKMHDGKRSMTVEIMRDNRVTGLRDHQIHRARARQELRTTDGDGLQSGKMRRYGDIYGKYYY